MTSMTRVHDPLDRYHSCKAASKTCQHVHGKINALKIDMPTVADTCLVLFFFLELATRLEYKAVLIFATRFKYLKHL